MSEAQASPEAGEREKRSFFRRHPRRTLVFLLILFICFLGLNTYGTIQDFTRNQIEGLPSQMFSVSGPPKLMIRADAGTIFVRARPRDTDKVFVFGYKHASGFGGYLDDISQQITQHGNTLDMTWRMKPEGAFGRGSESADLFIDVPANGKATLQVETSTADINIDGIKGQMTFKTLAGHVSIWGAMQGQSLVQTTSGAIDYCGRLDSQSTSSLQTTTGKITVTLPSTSALHLQASSKHGRISNEFHSSDVGIRPRAQIQMSTNSGTIILHNGGTTLASCE